MTQVFCVSICLYHGNNFSICLIYKKWVRPNTFLRDAGHFNRWLFNPKPRFFNHEVGVECPHRITRLLDVSTTSFSSPGFNLLFQWKCHGWRVHGWIARVRTGLKLWVKKYGAETESSGVKMSCNLFSGLEGLWPLYKNVFEWPPTTTSTSGTFLAISWSFSNPEWPTAIMIFTPLAFRFLASLSMDVISSRNLTFPGWEICWKIQKILLSFVIQMHVKIDKISKTIKNIRKT